MELKDIQSKQDIDKFKKSNDSAIRILKDLIQKLNEQNPNGTDNKINSYISAYTRKLNELKNIASYFTGNLKKSDFNEDIRFELNRIEQNQDIIINQYFIVINKQTFYIEKIPVENKLTLDLNKYKLLELTKSEVVNYRLGFWMKHYQNLKEEVNNLIQDRDIKLNKLLEAKKHIESEYLEKIRILLDKI